MLFVKIQWSKLGTPMQHFQFVVAFKFLMITCQGLRLFEDMADYSFKLAHQGHASLCDECGFPIDIELLFTDGTSDLQTFKHLSQYHFEIPLNILARSSDHIYFNYVASCLDLVLGLSQQRCT